MKPIQLTDRFINQLRSQYEYIRSRKRIDWKSTFLEPPFPLEDDGPTRVIIHSHTLIVPISTSKCAVVGG